MRTLPPLLALVLAFVLTPFAPARADGTDPTPPPPYDWGVAYYMSYDNDLERCGPIIIDGIAQGVAGRTVAAVQADFTDRKGMRRVTLRPGAPREETAIETEDSADEDQAIAYLRWFATTFLCKRYVVTFLDHGGKLDEMCHDAAPATKGREWMSGRVLGEKLRALAKELPGRWELLFLQQCGRGSIENLYSFRGTAAFIMSSPIPVGAPNTYYTALHRWLAENPEATGGEVAARIAAEDDHYTIYTCLRSPALADLPARLDRAIAPLLDPKTRAAANVPRGRPIHPVGEPIVDAKAFLERLSKASGGAGEREIAEFFRWTREELFTAVTFHERAGTRARQQLCGLSIYAPATEAERARYAALDLYGASRLDDLWKKLLAAPADSRRRLFAE